MNHRRVSFLALAVVGSALGCAVPMPGEGVGDSSDAFSSQRSIRRAVATVNATTGSVDEVVGFFTTGQSARVCYALTEGTDQEKRACDRYPTGYLEMTCADGPVTDYIVSGVATTCRATRPLGVAPLDRMNGKYRAYFVNVKTPADRRTFDLGDFYSSGQILRGTSIYDPTTDTVDEYVRFASPNEAARVCYAFLDGTAEQKSRCDAYPTNYVDMPCVDDGGGTLADLVLPGRITTACRMNRSVGQAPLGNGDGTYRAHFVSVKNSANRTISEPLVTPTDSFQLMIDSQDVPFGGARPSTIVPGARTPTTRTLHLTVQVKAAVVGQVKGCAAVVDTSGLAPAQIAQADAELLASQCAKPSVTLDGHDGWQTIVGSPTPDRAELKFDATPFLATGRDLLVAFEVNGRVRAYFFTIIPGA